jgi:hypothetical protein
MKWFTSSDAFGKKRLEQRERNKLAAKLKKGAETPKEKRPCIEC